MISFDDLFPYFSSIVFVTWTSGSVAHENLHVDVEVVENRLVRSLGDVDRKMIGVHLNTLGVIERTVGRASERASTLFTIASSVGWHCRYDVVVLVMHEPIAVGLVDLKSSREMRSTLRIGRGMVFDATDSYWNECE